MFVQRLGVQITGQVKTHTFTGVYGKKSVEIGLLHHRLQVDVKGESCYYSRNR